MKKTVLLLPLMLIAVAVSSEPIVRVVSAGGLSTVFARDEVRKLVLSADQVDVVNNAGSVLLTVPKTDIVRVEFADGTLDAVETMVVQDEKTVKIIENGQVYILHSGKKYTIMGVEVVKGEELIVNNE